ncbi:SDR family oxidoreductase [Allokutzneria sp. NRRL B-24872]|uniref:SDR family oxidoreductase n=1 Tax=Allokutzneria sp. NRRL B-24872 TaxID=1137961 RepID=UPI000A3B7B8A|nr:NAD(P)H-binding protein [Allokutzneria sp. NRRL B-24872]
MKILVTGATGNVGRIVVEQLVQQGISVRALTRDPARARLPEGVEVFAGDLTDPASLPLDGVDRMYLFPVPGTAEAAVARAVESGVKRIVTLSSGAVTFGHDTTHHLPIEQAVEASGLQWTHVRPGEFALNKLWLWGPSIRAESVVRDPNPDAGWFPTHERDIAEVAVTALTEDGHAGKAYDVNGPEQINYREQVQAIADALGREIRFEAVSRERARELYLAQGGFAAENADFLLGYASYDGEDQEQPDFEWSEEWTLPSAEPVTGRARTFAEWARDHVDDFR